MTPSRSVFALCFTVALSGLGCGDDSGKATTKDAGPAADGGKTVSGKPDAAGIVTMRGDAGDDAGRASDASLADAAQSGDDAGPATLSLSEFPAAAAAAFCKTLASNACCTNGTKGCTAEVTKELKDILAQRTTNKNVFSPEKAAECVAAIAAFDTVQCVTWFASQQPSLSACDATLDGTIAPGDSCNGPEQCQRGYANGTTAGGFVGCAQLGGVGPKRCRAFVPTTKVGTACEDGFAGTAATVHVCAGGLSCTGGHCEEPAACSASAMSGACASGKTCVAGVCKTFGGVGDDCSVIPCASVDNCNASNQCEALPPTPWILSLGFWSTQYACPP